MKALDKDCYGQDVKLPSIGDKVLRDGYTFVVNEVRPDRDVHIIASILLRGEGGSVEVGYYDYLLHKKAVATPVKHTEGEWKESGVTSDTRILDNKYICNVISPGYGLVADAFGRTKEEAQVNAKLIAASKEMLEAVKATKAFFDDMPKGQFGKLVCDVGLMNDMFLAMSKALSKTH